MTIAHVADIHFEGRADAAKKGLQKLKKAGLIGARARLVNEPAVLHLAPSGLSILSERGLLTNYPPLGGPALKRRAGVSEFTLAHELEVMDVKAAFHAAIGNDQTLSIVEFSTWPKLYEFQMAGGGTVKPDGFSMIHERKADETVLEHNFFVEVDRSTEMHETLISRACCYLDYYKSGGFAEWIGAARSAFASHPFRVLMVLKSEERRNNMAEELLNLTPPILAQVWLSTSEEVTTRPLDAIWIRPLDYREAVTGTRHDMLFSRPQWPYRRQTSRDIFVREKIKKQMLFPPPPPIP